MTMALLERQSVLDRIKYKPGWTFDRLEDGVITMRITANDVDHPHRIGILKYRIFIPADFDDLAVVRTIKLAVLEAEGHETDEAFRIDGAPLDNPHLIGEDPSETKVIQLTRQVKMERRWVSGTSCRA